MQSPEYENYYDNKLNIFEELKMDISGTEVLHPDCNVINEIVSEDKELSKLNDQNEIKHEHMEKGLPLNVKIERLEEERVLDNNEDMSVPYKLTVQDVELNSDERLLKNNLNLLKPNDEQTNSETNMATVIELNELHKCKHCDIFFDHHDNMLIHISLVHNEKTFKCELCGKQLNNVSTLKSHIILLHKYKEHSKVAQIIFKCINCNAEFKNRLTLKTHTKLCQKDHRRQCGINANKEEHKCNAVFKMKHNLTTHIEYIHYDYPHIFDCWCGKQFRSSDSLRQHKRRQHERKIKDYNWFQCDSCQNSFKSKYELVIHIKRVHYDYGRKFDCWCGKQFRSPEYLREHKRRHERKINDRFQCDSCQKIFKTKGNLFTHIKRFHYDYGRTFDCSCGKQFRSPEYLRQHKQRQHESMIDDRFQCDSCQRSFKYKYNLVIHIKKVHYDYGRTFDCWCGKQFRSPQYLHQHKQRQHERMINDTFRCDSCPKIYKAKGNLVAHIKKFHYDNGRTFDCSCGKQFRAPVLNKWQHERKVKDSDNDRLQCESCQKVFTKS